MFGNIQGRDSGVHKALDLFAQTGTKLYAPLDCEEFLKYYNTDRARGLIMFRYYFTQYFKPYQRQIKILYNTFFAYFLLELFVGVFGTLVLMAYFKNDTALEIQFMQNLPMSVKILFIHSCWFYVATCILIIFSLFFTPSFARAKNHNVGKILMEVKWQRWRFTGWIYIFFLAGFLIFIVYGLGLKLYAFGLVVSLICWNKSLEYISQNSLSITENGLLVGRIFSDVFIPYEHFYLLSEKDIQVALNANVIYFRYGEGSNDILSFELIVKNGSQVKESFMNLCNDKVKEFRIPNKKILSMQTNHTNTNNSEE
ncbi:hypothetical protein [Helicobacter typhlonius]|uniref:hypothetical protein n=1 Tax=Helicobacter typhlonius TaxID=76936 RepID=UPI002FE0EFE4